MTTSTIKKQVVVILLTAIVANGAPVALLADDSPSTDTTATTSPLWPAITSNAKPWTYWYWMGGAVDEQGITQHLERYHVAGLGGVHIVPVYGVRGAEGRYNSFLSPRWMELLAHTIREAERLSMGVDMTCGTGWPFGGPWVDESDAASRYNLQNFVPDASGQVAVAIRPQKEKPSNAKLIALIAYSPAGKHFDVTDKVDAAGHLDWIAPAAGWTLTAMFVEPTRLPVERAAPGGEGLTIDYFDTTALTNYLQKFNESLAQIAPLRVRCLYNDSYENWGANWTPKLFEEFESRRGYDLRAYLPKLDPTDISDTATRVRADYRETIADLIHDEFTVPWVKWAHERHITTRNEGHGSPGNLLDLYAAADIPETEVFGTSWLETIGLEPLPGVPPREGGPPEVQVCLMASSTAHVAGRPLCSSETCTWLGDHFKIPLEHMKSQADLMFVMGINHIFFHGAAYSPEDAEWPGWLWYASTNVGRYMPAWQHMPALCNYIARCQACLQTGRPDNQILVYLPIYDLWEANEGARDNVQYTIVHSTPIWFEKLMSGTADIGRTLWNRGFGFDYISDRQIAALSVDNGQLVALGGKYQLIVVPACHTMPETTMQKLSQLAASGATVIVHKHLPVDVPGFGRLEKRRAALSSATDKLNQLKRNTVENESKNGGLLVGDDIEPLLTACGIVREPMVDNGLRFVRRRTDDGWVYFVVNHSGKALEQWVPLSVNSANVTLLDPATARTGAAAVRQIDGRTQCLLQLEPRQSIILRANDREVQHPAWTYLRDGQPRELSGTWSVEFVEGGPTLPSPRQISDLSDWTSWNAQSPELQNFAGTARYVLDFELPESTADGWSLDLGQVCHSANVRLNGEDLGTTIASPFRVDASPAIRSGRNRLEVDVVNLPANRIRDLDRRGVDWKKFLFVDIRYQAFDASNWTLIPSGLIGPVKLIKQELLPPESQASAR